MLPVSDILRQVIYQKAEIPDHAGRFKASSPPVIVWNVTNRCHMNCPHCYSSAKRRDVDEISTDQAMEVIDKLAEASIRILIFSGGEPLLRADLLDLILYASQKKMQPLLSTSGVTITPELAVQLRKNGVQYTGISIDGLPEFNDRYRNFKNGYDLAMQGISNVKKAGMKTGIRMTLNQKNADHVFPLVQQALKYQVDRFYISHLVYGGRGAKFSAYDLSYQKCRELMIAIFDLALKNLENDHAMQFVSGGNDVDGAFLYLYVLKKFGELKAASVFNILKKRGGNSAGEKILNIDHLGNVHPDQFWRTQTCGNILNQDLEEILQHPLLKNLRNREDYLKGRCRDCCFLPVCRGSHRERAEYIYHDLWEQDPSCYLTNNEVCSFRKGE